MSKTKRKPYFGKEVQAAIIRYNELDKQENYKLAEKNALFSDLIYPAFMKLAENIINTKKYYRYDTSFHDLQIDAVAFLLEKMPKYQEDKGKAYSYFTIVCKNYLLALVKENYKREQQITDLTLVDPDRNIANEISRDNYTESLKDFLKLWCSWADTNLEDLFNSTRDKKIADSLIEIMRSSNDLDIYNKKIIYVLIRERAGVETQHITKVVKIFKEMFFSMFEIYQKEGIIDGREYL